jgi:hypothetical protein
MIIPKKWLPSARDGREMAAIIADRIPILGVVILALKAAGKAFFAFICLHLPSFDPGCRRWLWSPVQRQKDALRDLTGPRTRSLPVTELIGSINRQLRGWGNDFGRGYWRDAFHEINGYVLARLKTQLRHRSQRPFRVPEGQTHYHHLHTLGLVELRGTVSA